MSMTRTAQTFVGFSGALLITLSIACASPGQKSEPEIHTLGFLDNYAELAPGRSGQASLLYISDAADFSGYTAISVEPVTAWGTAIAEEQPTKRAIELAQRLDAGLRREFALAFDLVDEPRAGALRLRAALAEDGDSHLILEVEILDGASGDRVIAAVDRRSLGETSIDSGSANPIDDWPVVIRNRFATLRDFDAAVRAREEAAAVAP
jgi:hypothetical protein